MCIKKLSDTDFEGAGLQEYLGTDETNKNR